VRGAVKEEIRAQEERVSGGKADGNTLSEDWEKGRGAKNANLPPEGSLHEFGKRENSDGDALRTPIETTNEMR